MGFSFHGFGGRGACWSPLRGVRTLYLLGESMNQYVKSYAVFAAFTLLTAIVVRPLVKNVPIINQL